MGSESKVCPSCKLPDTFETAVNGAEELLLCVECGYLDTEAGGQWQKDEGYTKTESYTHNLVDDSFQMRYKPRVGVTHAISRELYKKKQHIVEGVGVLGLPNTVKKASLELFDRILPYFYHAKTSTISLACLFIAANRDGGSHVPLRDFCRRLHCDRYAIAKAKRWIIANKFEESDDPQRTSEAMIIMRLRERDIPVAYERKVARLMSLIEKGWVSSGRASEHFIWPCVFILSDCEAESRWRSVPPGEGEDDDDDQMKSVVKKLPRYKFYDHYRLKEMSSKTTFTTTVREVSDFLVSLTRHVPWLPAQQRGTKVGLVKSLDWFLNHLDWCRETIERCNAEGNDDKKKFLPRSLKNKVPSRESGTPVNSVETLHVPSGEELGDEDIKDEDLHLFIRSQREVDNITKLVEAQPVA